MCSFVANGEFICVPCDLNFRRSKTAWLGHFKSLHEKDFNEILHRKRTTNAALSDAIFALDKGDEVSLRGGISMIHVHINYIDV